MNVDVQIEVEEVESPKQPLVRMALSSGLVTVSGMLTAADAIGYGQVMVKIGRAAQRNHRARQSGKRPRTPGHNP